jgi:sulfite exporter TauE/SafE
MNPDISLISAFLIGIAGSVHCVGMCGGIVSAFSFILPKHQSPLPYMIFYNMGRITSYTIAGAITGYLGSILIIQLNTPLNILTLFSSILLMLMGLYIGGWWQILTVLEKAGSFIWKRISPYSKKFLPFKTPLQAFPYGFIWGWLPCGLVYSTLSWSLASGSALTGAGVMLAFGLGTLPALLSLGATTNSIKSLLSHSVFRKSVGLLLIAYSLLIIITNVTT